MRILYIDIDTLRPDHLGCYGYHRATSPNIDAVAQEGVLFTHCYTSDAPCLPSRMALLTGRHGFHNGVVGHGGSASELAQEGASRGFSSSVARTGFPARLRAAGLHTVTLSAFAERHSAFAWYAGFNEHAMVPKRGLEGAEEVCALARDWFARKGQQDDWFVHLHFWDPHTPYRAPLDYGEPFADSPVPAWLTASVLAEHVAGCGPHSAREAVGFSTDYPWGDYPRQPREVVDMAGVRKLFDGYDTGIRYLDDQLGELFAYLRELSIYDDTVIMISSDHGENLGELNVYGDHHTADEASARIPMIVRYPGAAPRVDARLCYQFDVAATLLAELGQDVPELWDGQALPGGFSPGQDSAHDPEPSGGRPFLLLSQGAWTCQRGVRFGDHLFLRTYHDGYHLYPERMLFDVAQDPHEQRDLMAEEPALAARAEAMLDAWLAEHLPTAARGEDPLRTVIREGGPFHVRGRLAAYLERLRQTGRGALAERLIDKHGLS